MPDLPPNMGTIMAAAAAAVASLGSEVCDEDRWRLALEREDLEDDESSEILSLVT